MSFASWRKCDFQVHTPRDPNWTGNRPIGAGEIIPETGAEATAYDVDAARTQWANEFVDQCTARGLQAVALTDHHEMVMVPYVQKAIADRKQVDPAFDLWLFPGMELTASGGKQCLIIFDAELSEEWRRQAQGKLAIVYADQDEKAGKSPKVNQLAINYADIAKELDALEELRGRYIVLPNVSQGSSHTVLVHGAHGDFRRMPYVGGYLDHGQTIDTLSLKNQKRLSGTDNTWSAREIYPLPTSDSRSADYAKLGQNNAWIKLAEPTAEAIRQAFLGHQSRIRIAQPQVPALVVAELEVEGSSILQSTDLVLSPEFNSAIGGRGSGKSSLLEYLSFGLGCSCYDVPREHYTGSERLRELVNDTLVMKGGCVRLKIIQDHAVFQVERKHASAYQPRVTYPSGDTQTLTVKELRTLFPAVVYSQGELSELGKQTDKKAQLSDLLQFVNPEYKREDDRLAQDIESARGGVRVAIQKLASHWSLQAKLHQLNANREALIQRVQALEKTLPEQSEEDQAITRYFDKANEFDSKRIQASKHADQILEALKASATELLNERDLESDLSEDTQDIKQAYLDIYKTFCFTIKQLQDTLKAKREALTVAEIEWAAKFKKAREARGAVLEKLSEHKAVTAQIVNLQEDVTDLTNQIGDIEMQLKAAGDPVSTLRRALATLRRTNRRRTERTQKWASEIEMLSGGKIKAVVDPYGDTSEIADAIDILITPMSPLRG